MSQYRYLLNEDWAICSGNDHPDADLHTNGIDESAAVRADLPCFAHMVIEDHLGISWYQKRFSLAALPEADERAILRFAMADLRAEVSMNGVVVGDHVGCEDPFAFDVTDRLCVGENRVTVRISKPWAQPEDGYTFDEAPTRNQLVSGIHPGFCYNESGISGDVELVYLPVCRIDDLFLEPDPETGRIRVHAYLTNSLPQTAETILSLAVYEDPAGEIVDRCEMAAALPAGGTTEYVTELTVPQHRLWSVDEPILYNVRAGLSCGEKNHTIQRRTGFRTFRVGDDGYFYLNGKRILLRSSHTGNCMPLSTHHISEDPALLRKDFLMAKAVGFNCIRFISGVALPLQLDLCDEIGLMVYEEPVSGWLSKDGPHTAELYRHDVLEMVRRDRNHPCVTIWGLLNETLDRPPLGGIVYDEAVAMLPKLRELDETRLVLLGSGRWDRQKDVGSLCNPHERTWQTLWNGEGMGDPIHPELLFDRGWVSPMEMGDVHYYPQPIPMTDDDRLLLRSYGKAYERPTFVSEGGIGSQLDTISLVRRWESQGITGFYPDVKAVKAINDTFLQSLADYGFADAFPFPSELMAGSMRNHADYRTQYFDLLRSDPLVCGISLTGLLDHSICGEGLWTLFREYKPMIADVLQCGFAALRWSVLPDRRDLFCGEVLRVEAVLANEDVLKPGQVCRVRAGILTKNGTRMVRDYEFTVSGALADSVFTDTWDTADLPAGDYTFKVELMNGGDAAGGTVTFRLNDRPNANGRTVFGLGLSDGQQTALASLGAVLRPADQWDGTGKVLCGQVEDADLPMLTSLLERGAEIIAADTHERSKKILELLPEERRPEIRGELDWLYHKETVLRPGDRRFAGMDTGVMDCVSGVDVFPLKYLHASGASIPDDTSAMIFSTTYPIPGGCLTGFALGTYHVGGGRLVLNTFRLPYAAEMAPAAAKLLVNLIG